MRFAGVLNGVRNADTDGGEQNEDPQKLLFFDDEKQKKKRHIAALKGDPTGNGGAILMKNYPGDGFVIVYRLRIILCVVLLCDGVV